MGINVLELPVKTQPGVVWKELWAKGIDIPHPTSDQTLEDWISELPREVLIALNKFGSTNPHQEK